MNTSDPFSDYYKEWRKTDCGQEVVAFAKNAVIEALITGNPGVAIPVNMHTLMGLFAPALPVPVGNLLRDLARFYYENPERAAEAWEHLQPSLQMLQEKD